MNLPAGVETELTALYSRMDREFDHSAARSGFICNGCEDNCCRTRFYHHTLAEWLYLRSGLTALAPEHRQQIGARADAVRRQMVAMEGREEAMRIMCPLNEAGRCALYVHRPMICRLHGIPHCMRQPDGRLVTGPGCDDYYAQCGRIDARPLDRTPLYIAMAGLERRLREALGFNRKIKLTVAEMIINEIY